jgi:hypothetical protein
VRKGNLRSRRSINSPRGPPEAYPVQNLDLSQGVIDYRKMDQIKSNIEKNSGARGRRRSSILNVSNGTKSLFAKKNHHGRIQCRLLAKSNNFQMLSANILQAWIIISRIKVP